MQYALAFFGMAYIAYVSYRVGLASGYQCGRCDMLGFWQGNVPTDEMRDPARRL